MSTQFSKMLVQPQPQEFQFLNEKMIVDFVNGISVAQDLNTTIKKRSSHGNRFMDAISGKGHLRQAHFNEHVLTGLQACEGWLKTLSGDIHLHSAAIERISSSLSKTQQHLVKVTNVVIDIREQVNILNQQTKILMQDVQGLKISDKAKTQLELVFSSWQAGDLQKYSALEKCYIALDNLYWGNFSQALSLPNRDDFMKILKNKLVSQLKDDLGVQPNQIILREDWMQIQQPQPAQQELLEYMGDWSLKQPKIISNAFLATQWATLDEQELNKPEIKHIPFHIADIHTVTERMINEFFKVRKDG